MCATNKTRQSPILIHDRGVVRGDDSHMVSLTFPQYEEFTTVVDDRSLRVVPAHGGQFIGEYVSDGFKHRIIEAHVHAPGEHAVSDSVLDVESWKAAVEIHIVTTCVDLCGLVRNAVISLNYKKCDCCDCDNFCPQCDVQSKCLEKLYLDTQNYAINHPIKCFNFNDMFGEKLLEYEIYRYAGSLTTAPYSENVSWNVLKKKIKIHKGIINRIVELLAANGHKNNARQLQNCAYNNANIQQVFSSTMTITPFDKTKNTSNILILPEYFNNNIGDFVIRSMTIDDAEAVRILVTGVTTCQLTHSIDIITSMLQSIYFHPFVVEDMTSRNIIGYAELYRLPHMGRRDDGRLERVIIDEEYRGHNIGTILCNRIVYLAKNYLNCNRIDVTVEKSDAKHIYRYKLQFKPVETEVMRLKF